MLLKKIFRMGRISGSINDTETEYASVEDPLFMHRTASNETTLVSNIITKENFIIALGEGKKHFQFYVMNFVKSSVL